MQQSILQIIFNLRPLEIQRSTQICTYRYWGIQACGALHQTRVAIELARGKNGRNETGRKYRENFHSINLCELYYIYTDLS